MRKLSLCMIVMMSFLVGCKPTDTLPNGANAFEQLKSLQGDWVAKPAQGLTYISYGLASSGSVLR